MLSVADVHVAYGQTPALAGVGLTVQPGEIVSIIGRNGVGKTTLMKTIIGLLRAGRGAIPLAGEYITRLPAYERARRGIGYVPQGRMIFADLTVEENLLIGADLNRAGARGLIEEVLEEFPLLRERYRQRGGTLSGGEQQMLALGRALVGGPKVLLLDEPSEGIQPSIVQEMEAKIAAINRARGLAIVLVEQNIEFAAALARRVYVMEKGRIAREISPEHVMDEDIVRDYLAV
jgi:branched-chain amino acid transport system ATP-binding protein